MLALSSHICSGGMSWAMAQVMGQIGWSLILERPQTTPGSSRSQAFAFQVY